MASLGINKCDRCGVEIRVPYNVGYAGGSPEDPETKIVRVRGYIFCLSCGEPVLRALAEIFDEMKRDRRTSTLHEIRFNEVWKDGKTQYVCACHGVPVTLKLAQIPYMDGCPDNTIGKS